MKRKFLSLALLGLGVFILVQVIMPIVAFEFWQNTVYNQNISLVTPDPNSQVLGVSVKNIDSFPALVSSNRRATEAPYKTFMVTIPSINLGSTLTVVDSNSFDNNLAHLPGSALPGERGNVFITGHSSLPQLFKPDNFKAIFSGLPNIKKGDEVIVDAGGQRFDYVVKGLKVVDPSETWVINPPDQTGRYLTLMTCVPPGFFLKRLIVLAELKQ